VYSVQFIRKEAQGVSHRLYTATYLKPCNIGNSLSGPQCLLAYWDAMSERRELKHRKGRIAEELIVKQRRLYSGLTRSSQ
jgi:hypothetical protein